MRRWKKALRQKLPFFEKLPLFDAPDDGPCEDAYAHVRLRGELAAACGVVRSQIPGHNPAHAKLPALAGEWFARYDAGCDVSRWYTAARNQPS